MSLPLTAYHSYEHYVQDLDRAERYYTQCLGFKRIGRSKPEATAKDGMQRLVLAGGKHIHVILTKPVKASTLLRLLREVADPRVSLPEPTSDELP